MRNLKFILFVLCMTSSFANALLNPNLNDVPADARTEIRNLATEFMRNFPGCFTVDRGCMEKVGDFVVPEIRNGDLTLNKCSAVGNFAARTKAMVVIFAKVNRDFVRIATSCTDGTNNIGTTMDRNIPAYMSLLNGMNYTDKVSFWGKEYLAEYNAIRDIKGQPIGAFFIAIPYCTPKIVLP